jgi:hypothetical protein
MIIRAVIARRRLFDLERSHSSEVTKICKSY